MTINIQLNPASSVLDAILTVQRYFDPAHPTAQPEQESHTPQRELPPPHQHLPHDWTNAHPSRCRLAGSTAAGHAPQICKETQKQLIA